MSESSDRSDSVLTDNADHFLNNDDLNDALKLQKEQQYHCLNKLDQQFNASNIAMINQHQDTDFNEAMASVENLMNICMLNIHKNDGLIQVANPAQFTSARTNTSSKGRRATKNEPVLDMLSYENSITSSDSEKSIVIDSLIPLDFIRNGLKSGPLPNRTHGLQLPHEQTNLTASERKSTGAQSAAQSTGAATALPAISRSNTQQNISLASQLNYKLLMGVKNQVVFKYIIAIDLNSEYFDCQIINDREAVYSIKALKKPQNWTKYDYDLFTVDIQSTHKEPLNRICSNILGLSKENQKKLVKIKPIRYLNSKALFDRLYRHFYKTIVKDWSSLEGQNLKFGDEFRICEMKDNQLKIVLKYKGNRQKDLDIIIYLNIAIKYTDEIIDSKTLDSMVLIANNYFQNGGFFTKPPVITRNSMILIINWMHKNLRINLSSIYLVPNFVHYWTLYLLPLKMNFLVWLIWLNSFTPRSVGVDIIIGLFNGEDKGNTGQIKLLVANHLSNKGTVMKKNQTLPLIINNLGNSNLFLLVRMIQLFNYLSLSKHEIASKMENYTGAEEELIADLVFLEMNCYFNSRGQRIKYFTGELWSHENLFDRFWSCLLKLRSSMIVEHILQDPFKIFRNSLPKTYIKHITLQFYNRIQLLYYRNPITANNDCSQSDTNELRNCIETGMKLLFINIVNDDTREIRNLSQNKSHSIMLSDIKRQNTMNLPISMANTIGSNLDYNDV